jgi:YbbR domain-containing protein
MLETLDRIVRRVFVRNLHLKVIALLLTLALYLWVSVDREVERTRYAPLRMDIPAETVLVNNPPERIGVTIRGKWSDLARLDPADIDAIRVSVDAQMGNKGQIPLTPDMVELPPGLRALGIEPNLVQFQLEKKTTRTVPIRPKITGEPAQGYEVEDVSVRPSSLEVSGPARSLENLTAVGTESIDLSGRTSSFSKKVRPRLNDSLVEHNLGEAVVVSIQLDAQQVERIVQDLKVVPHQHQGALVTSIEPQSVDVTLRGPKSVVDKLEKTDLLASVDLSGHPKGVNTTLLETVEIHNVPSGVEIVRTQPQTFRVRLHAQKSGQQAQEQAQE